MKHFTALSVLRQKELKKGNFSTLLDFFVFFWKKVLTFTT